MFAAPLGREWNVIAPPRPISFRVRASNLKKHSEFSIEFPLVFRNSVTQKSGPTHKVDPLIQVLKFCGFDEKQL